MSTFTGNKLTCRWVSYVDWRTILFKVKLVRVLKTAFNDFSTSEVRLEAGISHHQRLPVSFHDVLKNNFVAWMVLLFFECDSLMVFLFDEKGLKNSTWPPCAFGFFMSQSVPIMFFFATATLQYGLHCGASKQGLRLVFRPQVCAKDSFMTAICGGKFASESSNLFCVIFVVHWLPQFACGSVSLTARGRVMVVDELSKRIRGNLDSTSWGLKDTFHEKRMAVAMMVLLHVTPHQWGLPAYLILQVASGVVNGTVMYGVVVHVRNVSACATTLVDVLEYILPQEWDIIHINLLSYDILILESLDLKCANAQRSSYSVALSPSHVPLVGYTMVYFVFTTWQLFPILPLKLGLCCDVYSDQSGAACTTSTGPSHEDILGQWREDVVLGSSVIYMLLVLVNWIVGFYSFKIAKLITSCSSSRVSPSTSLYFISFRAAKALVFTKIRFWVLGLISGFGRGDCDGKLSLKSLFELVSSMDLGEVKEHKTKKLERYLKSLGDDFASFARCVRVSQLVGDGFVERYYPIRVSMQFGLAQDLPGLVNSHGEFTEEEAWGDFNKPLDGLKLYMPSTLARGSVTAKIQRPVLPLSQVVQNLEEGFPPTRTRSSMRRLLANKDKTGEMVNSLVSSSWKMRNSQSVQMKRADEESSIDEEDDNMNISQRISSRKKYSDVEKAGEDASEQLGKRRRKFQVMDSDDNEGLVKSLLQ
ncbi:hypothetical protein Bca52824_033525 [Brassica carinata]|uniref:Aminotransferase-like plant mobile domain-containing protein n=1 Tax=Brassica carinata TaxID=52824 RepID=A0A8X7V758_BRACI|nr:hypothetical protein Bca52824_033525 [Brassica carinata]